MVWFQEVAPIRQKMMVAFCSMTLLVALTAIVVLSAAVTGHATIGVIAGVVLTLVAAASGAWMRKAVCDPYVSTVVRMEGLAAGDLDTPIAHTNYQDCVGRMTKAMFTFKETATTNLAQTAAQEQLVAVLSSHLSSLR